MSEEAKKQSVRNTSKLYLLGTLGIIIFVCGVIISGLVIKIQPQVLGLSSPSELASLISQVEKLIVLPTNELPTVTTINDVTKLNDQTFFKNAQTNDKLLVYTNTKWAVLYRPSENRIIEVGAFDPSQLVTTSPTVSPLPSPSDTPIPTPAPTLAATPTLNPTPSIAISTTASPTSSPEPR